MDWDDAYANGKYIPETDEIVAGWTRDAAAFRASTRATLDQSYGSSARQVFDLFLPDGDPKGLFVFVHGGYWLAFDKSSWSHLAGAAVARGFAAVLPSYDLCPDASIAEIAREVAACIHLAAAEVKGPIILSGHSAGGQLVVRLICEASPLDGAVAARVRRTVGISGLYDLRPLMQTQMNKTLKLTEAMAASESPALQQPREGAEIIAWVGGSERPEFLRQSHLLEAAWQDTAARCVALVEPEKHHFNVIAGLSDPLSPLSKCVFAD